MTFVTSGLCEIDANQAGDTNYTAAPPARQSVTPGLAPQSITFASHRPEQRRRRRLELHPDGDGLTLRTHRRDHRRRQLLLDLQHHRRGSELTAVGSCVLETPTRVETATTTRPLRCSRPSRWARPPPTVSISNLPASGTYGGSFTPSIATNSDTGTTSFVSNSSRGLQRHRGGRALRRRRHLLAHRLGEQRDELRRGDRLGADLQRSARPPRPSRSPTSPPRAPTAAASPRASPPTPTPGRPPSSPTRARSAASPRGSCTTSASAPARSPPR